MSAIYLVRHGQASYGKTEYDELSAVGVRQSGRLGAWWAERGQRFDAIYVGPRRRQIDTAQHMVEAGRSAGADWPAPTAMAELDELPAFELLAHWLPILRAERAELREQMEAAAARGDHPAALEIGFRSVINGWCRGELEVAHLESFARFRDRVEAGLARIARAHPSAADGPRARVAVVTSGGPIAIALRQSLGFDDDSLLRVMWVIRNGSFSEFRGGQPAGAAALMSGARALMMIDFNAIPHLDKELVTYR